MSNKLGKRGCVTPLLALSAGIAHAQDVSNVRPLRIATSQSGSGSDAVARILTERLAELYGQSAVVDNRGILAPEIAAKAAPDGYTVLFYSTALWVAPLMNATPQWDAKRDFAAVTLAVNAPNLLAVHPSLPVKSVRDLVALGKAHPGQLNYGSGSSGSSSHLATELFNANAGVTMTRIPFRGVGPALLGLLGGHVQVLFPSAGSGVPHVKSGCLRALAVTSAKRSAVIPDLPTVAASSVPGYEADTPLGVFVRPQPSPRNCTRASRRRCTHPTPKNWCLRRVVRSSPLRRLNPRPGLKRASRDGVHSCGRKVCRRRVNETLYHRRFTLRTHGAYVHTRKRLAGSRRDHRRANAAGEQPVLRDQSVGTRAVFDT